MVLVDPFLLTVTLVMAVVLIISNIYLVAQYSHASDSAFGSSTACKVVIILAFMCAECQILMLPLDVSNYRVSSDI